MIIITYRRHDRRTSWVIDHIKKKSYFHLAPPEGPSSSTPTVFKNGSIMLLFLSSHARLSFSLLGIHNPSHEIMTSANSEESAVSTAWRRRIAGLTLVAVVSDELEVVSVRVLRRKLPAAEMKEDGDDGDKGWSAEKMVDDTGVAGIVGDFDAAGGGRAGMVVTGATSFAMRASMKVRNVNETLWAGKGARISNTQACASSVDRGCSLALSRAIRRWSMSCQTLEVIIPPFKERRKAISVSDKISKR